MISSDDDGYYDDEECSQEPISFGLIDNTLSLSFGFTTNAWIAPERQSGDAAAFIDDDGNYDEDAAANTCCQAS